MSTLETSPIRPARKRLSGRKMALIAALLVVVFFLGHQLLIARMMLPRLIINQGTLVTELDVTPDGKTVIAGTAPNEDIDIEQHPLQRQNADAFVWGASDGRLMNRLPGFDWRSEWIAASPDGTHVMAFGTLPSPLNKQFALNVWDWRTGHRIWSTLLLPPFCYSPNGRLIGSADGIYDALTGKLVRRLADNDRYADDGQCKFTPDAKLYGLINGVHLDARTGYEDESDGARSVYSTNRMHLWDVQTGKEVQDFPFTRVRAFDFTRDGRWLIMVSDRGDMINASDGSVIRCVNRQTGAVAWTRDRSMNDPDHDRDAHINCVAVSPNGKYVVVESDTNRLTVLDAKTGQALFYPWILWGHGRPGWSIPGGLAFPADGRTLVSRCGANILVWDASALQ